MNYELAKQLKDAGFAIEEAGDADSIFQIDDVWYKTPTLSELIESCGDRFGVLVKVNKEWLAFDENYAAEDGLIFVIDNGVSEPTTLGIGSTPEEAVAKLWLKLNEK